MDIEKQRYLELADFLKTRRSKILPSQVGLPLGNRRRTPGLRREEVAQLAGIGVTWYTWLEQGRPINVSSQIIESLSRVLLLNRQERNHLYILAKQPLPVDSPDNHDFIPSGIQNVLNNLPFCPAFIMDQRWNVIAWNKAACYVFGDYGDISIRERNIVWMMFTNIDYRSLFIDWHYHAQGLLARFRAACSQYIEDPWFITFIHDLKEESQEFALWWSEHEVNSLSQVGKKLILPSVGELNFDFFSFDLSDDPSLKLIVNTPKPGTDTLDKMKAMLNHKD